MADREVLAWPLCDGPGSGVRDVEPDGLVDGCWVAGDELDEDPGCDEEDPGCDEEDEPGCDEEDDEEDDEEEEDDEDEDDEPPVAELTGIAGHGRAAP